MAQADLCYSCKFRRDIPGDAHSACAAHPWAAKIRGEKPPPFPPRSKVSINAHAARRGWASWPLSFDPIWVEECTLHKPKEA